jgi:hypothetical protein
MSLELVNTLATFGTFFVIAATAIAALVQLRHARSSNHIAALNELRESMDTSNFQAASQFVRGQLSAKLQDPAFRYQLGVPAARTDEARAFMRTLNMVGNFYESLGVLVKAGSVEQELVIQIWATNIIEDWDKLVSCTAIYRRTSGPVLWENFEYLAVLAQDWMAANPNGTYPAGARRLELKDEWLETDKQYAASLVPA